MLIDVRDLTVQFERQGRLGQVVRGVSYAVRRGETLGIVGESGSGKSVHILAMLGLLPCPPGRIAGGTVLFEGQNLLGLSPARLSAIRGRRIGMIFQDPMAALNPVLSIGAQMSAPLRRHLGLSRVQARARAQELLALVGMTDPRARLDQYPFELSGGMRQRVMIAMAISCEPELLIADEPTTALDVTVQSQILDLLRDLKQRLGMTMIWVTHDMGVVAGIADTIQVMYGGRIMERGPVGAVFSDPRSAYTWSLLRSLPGNAGGERLYQIPGQPPNPFDAAPGDPFAPRNPFATERCFREAPPLIAARDSVAGHLVAAWYDLPTARVPA